MALIPGAKLYLYGSYARGEAQAYSDIDLALEALDPLPREYVGEVRDMLNASNMPYQFDVVDLNSVHDALKKNIVQNEGAM